MEQPLLTIGAFARAVGLAPSALRYYDECGLLRPADVDEATGYRYYTPDLARRAHAVAQAFWYVNRFRDHLAAAPIGFSPAEGAFQGDDPVEVLRAGA